MVEPMCHEDEYEISCLYVSRSMLMFGIRTSIGHCI